MTAVGAMLDIGFALVAVNVRIIHILGAFVVHHRATVWHLGGSRVRTLVTCSAREAETNFAVIVRTAFIFDDRAAVCPARWGVVRRTAQILSAILT